jgi:hypothetical protein
MFFVYVDTTDTGIPYYVGKGNVEMRKRLSEARTSFCAKKREGSL